MNTPTTPTTSQALHDMESELDAIGDALDWMKTVFDSVAADDNTADDGNDPQE